MFAVAGGAGFLTVQALRDDARDPLFQEARKKADAARERAIQLAGTPEAGIPPDGSAYILRRDPLTHGRAVLERRCLGCHVDGGKGSGTQTASRPRRVRLPGLGPRAARESAGRRPTSARSPSAAGWPSGRMSSKLEGQQLDEVADFVASFARIPADMTPERVAQEPRGCRSSGIQALW